MRKIVYLFFALILIWACWGLFDGRERVSGVEDAAQKGILLINNGGEPSALDPQFAQPGVIENRLMLALFEGLVCYDPKTLEARPALAESWQISKDKRTYTFTLRDDARFSDGRAISSKDFLFSYQRILSPRLASPCASLFFAPVKNARAFNSGKISDFSEVGFRAPDLRTLVVELEEPCPYFLQLACHFSWSVVPAHTILKFGEIDERSNLWTRPENFVGSGPFTLKTWRVAYRIETKINPFYHGVEKLKLKGICFDALENQFAEESAFNNGQYHITNTVPPSRVASLREQGVPELRLDPYFSTAFIRVNTKAFPLNDPRVRRALSLALDRQELAEKVMCAGETPAIRFVPQMDNKKERLSFLCEKAKIEEAQKLLAEAGFPNGNGFPEISYLYNTSDGAQIFAQAIQEMWRKNLGIKLVLKNQEYKVYRTSLAQGDYELARSAWSGDYLDPTTFLELFVSNGTMNWTYWENKSYDELLAKAKKETRADKREKILADAERILLEDLPIIPSVFSRNKFLIRKEVQGWFPNLLDIHPYNGVYFQETNSVH